MTVPSTDRYHLGTGPSPHDPVVAVGGSIQVLAGACWAIASLTGAGTELTDYLCERVSRHQREPMVMALRRGWGAGLGCGCGTRRA
jgi:hypothetical protein